jgi:hypothetical protein
MVVFLSVNHNLGELGDVHWVTVGSLGPSNLARCLQGRRAIDKDVMNTLGARRGDHETFSKR